MEALFELFSNPIAIFILIGVISSLFNKAKENAKEQQQRRARPSNPPVAESVSAPAEMRDRRKDTPRDSERTSKPVKPAPARADREPGVLSEVQKVYQEKKRQAERSPSSQRKTDRGSRLSAGETTGRLMQEKRYPEPESSFQPDRDRVVEGLIWAEVLSPPRSKKPYNPSRRN